MQDFSTSGGMNPTKWLSQHYQEVMDGFKTDPDGTADMLLQQFASMVGHGYDKKNFNKFRLALAQARAKGTEALQFYLTNFMMKGMGEGVVEAVAWDDPMAIGGLLCEDSDEFAKLRRMVGRYGFVLVPVNQA